MITSEMVQERREQLIAERDQLFRTLNALTGAIQDCEYWLGVLAASSETGRESENENSEPDSTPAAVDGR